MTNRGKAKPAAAAAAIGLIGLAGFQLMLAAGAPLGEAAWGGTHEGRLPSGLRVGSGVSILVYAAAAVVVLRRGGFAVRWVPAAAARIGTWVLVGLLSLGTLANLASSSPWERFLLAPGTLVVAVLCLIVARSGTASYAGSSTDSAS